MKTNALIVGLFLGAATLVSCSNENEVVEPQVSTNSGLSEFSNERVASSLSGEYRISNYVYNDDNLTEKFEKVRMVFFSSGELIAYNGDSKYRGYYKYDSRGGALYIEVQGDDIVDLLAASPWKIKSDYRGNLRLLAQGRELYREMTINKRIQPAPAPVESLTF